MPHPRESYPHTLTPKQVKEFMNIGINQVYKLIQQPDFPKWYMGRSPRIPRDRFFEWYEKQADENAVLEADVH